MKHNLLFLTCAMQFGMATSYAQINLAGMGFATSDSLQKCKIRYFSPGKGGKNRVWDFSRTLSSNESLQVMFYKDSTGIVSVHEPGRILYCHTLTDTLTLVGSECPTDKRQYVRLKAINIFPLEYSKSFAKRYRCEGLYCGNHPFRETGNTSVEEDAIGSIVLAEDDTLKNVRRVHTIDTYSVCMDISRAALDTARLTQVIDERYDWYMADSQYPIFENIVSTTYHNMEVLGTTRRSYCNLPENWAEKYITEDIGDEFTEQADSLDVTTEPDIIHYSLGIEGGVARLSYDLDADAEINIIVANHMGMTYRHKAWSQKAGQGYTAEIDCSGLRPGQYIFYINVNGKIYSEKVCL